MDAERPAPAQLAKGALRRLAIAKLEPTPAHYARAYAEEAGEPLPAEGTLPPRARAQVDRLMMRASDDATLRGELASALMEARYDDLQRALDRGAAQAAAQGPAWAQLIDRLVRGLERGAKHWTGARKKDSLQRVLDGSRSDAQRLQQRLKQLVAAWESDQPDEDVDVDAVSSPEVAAVAASAPVPQPVPPAAVGASTDELPRIVDDLQSTVQAGLPAGEPRAAELADELAVLAKRVATEGATPVLADAVAEVCHRVRRLYGLRHELVDELLALCHSLTDGLADLAEDRSWAQGQGESLRQRLQGAAGARAVRAARELLDDTRERQRALQAERAQARDALKLMVRQVLSELGELGSATGRFNDKVNAYAQAIEEADSLDSLASAVREMVDESRTVHELVAGARERLSAEHARASALESRVLGLESELRRLSDEVSTDALTQVANRRGLAQAFEQETARVQRDGTGQAPLAVGLIDIDNFKKLNDSLGHAAGDVALQSLAARVKEWLRPVDHIARFGGEEFVLLLPGTPVDEAQQVVTRLQRRLSASLFMHEGKDVFVTFSAGVTAWRPGEAVDAALARADEGLYEAKRTGKNRTCVA
ncbi:MAG: diguanylate cyclase [Burkholderiales bacterium RIFCSPHIGHO2_12_FULL_69_20]|nr:MAG: diguanylate cyclase [Burkholderiales bacterium RIFCSPHIGHO2_12_FULL_69_20]